MAAKRSLMPRARKEGLEIQDLVDEVLVYDLERHRAHCLNPVASLVWRRCDGRTSLAQVAAILEKRYDFAAAEDIVRFAVERLKKTHLLEEPSAPASGRTISSRRELLKKLGLAATVMLPAVTSIVAPSPAHAASCIPPAGCVAGVNDCASCSNPGGECQPPFLCCGGVCRAPGLARSECGC